MVSMEMRMTYFLEERKLGWALCQLAVLPSTHWCRSLLDVATVVPNDVLYLSYTHSESRKV